MAAIISDKFRIFNAKQFLESLSEPVGGAEDSPEKTRMYFFVGRPQRWDAFLEIYSQNAVAFAENQFVYVASDGNGSYTYANSPFKASIEQVYDNSLILSDVTPSVNSTPLPNAVLEGWNGAADTGAEARAGVYRYATEDTPPTPLDNQIEKFSVYDEIIAAKRITDQFARAVITRYDWNLLATEPRFDMYKPDYSATTTGQVGKQSTTGAASLGASKFYVINSNYEVFKCLYNGQFPGQVDPNPVYEPKTTPSAGQGTYDAGSGLFTESADAVVANTAGSGYIWKYMYTIPTDDVLRFLSTNFMPINLTGEATRAATEAAAVDGAIDVVLVEDIGSGLPNGTHYAPVLGDGQVSGTQSVVKIVVSSGSIESTEVVVKGAGYTYASIALDDGATVGGIKYGLYAEQALTTARTGVGGTGALEVVLPPQGGHGADFELELNAKRVMTNIRLTYAEGSGDFPVDNDFRRIGIIKDPFNWSTTDFAVLDTLNGLYAAKITGASADYVSDETITQALAGGGTAKGTVVSWTLDSGSTTDGVLKYIQSPDLHADQGVVRAFDDSANIVGSASLASGAVATGVTGTTLLGVSFTNGFGTPEIEQNSGDIIYVENRRLITRAADQIEDIKLVIEF
ncbi:baseplate wedge subunit [Cyanophage S-RIM44]|uniref:Baseplate wedge subunit n=2 Tax=Vellamovirus TaxID=2733139 RepID=A0A127KN21_9CAUD|nr:baseplate wedge subunit [Prochlorococcus phage Syn1]AMO43339.1 baseplate wedge subunit [Cyanophage S-RIM44]ADO99197.1 baseplate wedge [Prochlorococcus phage Syn1]AOO11811.1 baseplate wedge subunit [Cyanophage S-RIM44]AOO12512.1 baseplate wedge subunit [Cyanophage S-RIM44]AOO12978.1 baseplate wedge subunit [Cyanophage S-RIM44]